MNPTRSTAKIALALACALLLAGPAAAAANRRKHMSGLTKDRGLKTTLGPRGRNFGGSLGEPQAPQAQTSAFYATPANPTANAAAPGAAAANAPAPSSSPAAPRARSRTSR